MSLVDSFTPATVEGGMVRHGDDSNLFVEFYWRDKLNKPATEKAGRPIYRQVEYIHIFAPGDKTTEIHREVKDSDKQRWPARYNAFKADDEQPAEGTPLSEWTLLTVAQRAELKALGFRTVENVAAMTDSQMDRIGMGARKLKTAASGYLDKANEGVGSAQMAAELDKRDQEILALRTQLESALERLDEVAKASPREDAPTVADAPEKADGGDDDPDAESSLAALGDDDLPEPRPVAKKRGRPKKKAA